MYRVYRWNDYLGRWSYFNAGGKGEVAFWRLLRALEDGKRCYMEFVKVGGLDGASRQPSLDIIYQKRELRS